ncbi:relaxase/mobilization nuclease domain-containing protein [Cetobacterium sp.]|uniref:relaxase/mobilization nuclease domain-containing protein n=1 Tax=Cetobacterium sp. TaxID=2071632 RepID=UPI003EE457E4
MAILKGIGNPSSKSGGAKSALEYVGKKADLTKGIYCSNDWKEAFNDFQTTKEFYNKENGRQYLHYVQSFKEGEVTPEEALELTEKFCNKIIKDNEVFLAVHTDQKHIHCHMIVNSVSYVDGHKFQCSRNDLEKWKEISNEINKDYGLEIPQKTTEQGKIIAWKKEQYMALKKSLENKEVPNDSLNLVNSILEISKCCQNKNEFIEKMDSKGYQVDWQDHKKNITFTVSENILTGKKNKFRLNTLGKTFNHEILSKEGLENEFSKTREQYERPELSRVNTGKQSIERTTNELSEHQQETGFRIKVDDRAIQQNGIITRESFRESFGLRRVNTLDDKRHERESKQLAEENERELKSRNEQQQRSSNKIKRKTNDRGFDITD